MCEILPYLNWFDKSSNNYATSLSVRVLLSRAYKQENNTKVVNLDFGLLDFDNKYKHRFTVVNLIMIVDNFVFYLPC